MRGGKQSRMARRPLSVSLMTVLTAKQMLCGVCAYASACLRVGSKAKKREKPRDRKYRQMPAFTLWEAQGYLPRT